MGGYLGRTRPLLCPPPLTVSTRDLQKRPSPPVHRVSRPLRVNSVDGCLNEADSLPFEDGAALAHPQQYPERNVVDHTQQNPVETFSSILLGSQHKSVPALSSSRMSRSSVILKVFSTKGRDTLRFILGQPVLIIWSFLTGHLLTQSRKETQISALQESNQVQTKEKKDFTTLGEGGEGFANQEEGSPVTERPCDQGKDSDRSMSVLSAFTRLFVNGVLFSFIPKPGPLGGDICSKNSAKSCIKEDEIAFKSSCKRNAIASSYSSSLAQWPPERMCVPGAPSGAQGASKGAAARDTRGAVPGSASGVAACAATGDASGAATGGVARATTDAAPGATSGAVASAASGDGARDTQGAVPGAASGTAAGITLGAAFGVAACAAPGAATGAVTSVTSGAAAWVDPGDASGAAAGTDAHAPRGALRGAAARATRGSSKGAAARATRGALGGAAARAIPGSSKGTAARATQGSSKGAVARVAQGALRGAAACATRGSLRAAAACAIRSASRGAAVRATRSSLKGAAACATRGAFRGAAAHASRCAFGGAAARATRGALKDAAAYAVSLPGWALSHLQVLAKRGRSKSCDRSSSGSPKKKKRKHREAEQATITVARQVQQEDPGNGLPTSGIPRPVRRKIPLLLPHRRGVPLILPQSPELCFDITVDDCLEKKTAVQWTNKTLKGAKAWCN